MGEAEVLALLREVADATARARAAEAEAAADPAVLAAEAALTEAHAALEAATMRHAEARAAYSERIRTAEADVATARTRILMEWPDGGPKTIRDPKAGLAQRRTTTSLRVVDHHALLEVAHKLGSTRALIRSIDWHQPALAGLRVVHADATAGLIEEAHKHTLAIKLIEED